MGSSRTAIICGTFLLFGVLGGVFALAWHGTFTSAEVYSIVMSIITIASSVFAVHTGIKAAKAQAPVVHNHTHMNIPPS